MRLLHGDPESLDPSEFSIRLSGLAARRRDETRGKERRGEEPYENGFSLHALSAVASSTHSLPYPAHYNDYPCETTRAELELKLKRS